MGLSKEVKEILKKIKQRDLAIIEEGFNILEENEQYLEDLLASVSVNNSTGEIERGKDFKGSKPALVYSDMALFKLLSISRPNSLGEKLRKKIKKIEINVIGIPILNGFDNLEHLNITLTNDRAEFYDKHAWPSDLGEFGKFKNLRFIKISLDRKVASNHRMLSMPEHTKPYVNSLNGLEAPLLEHADFKNIGLIDIESISNSPKLKTLNLSQNIEFRNLEGLINCIEIEELDLSTTSIESINSLSKMSKLKILTLCNCKSLKSFKGIEELSIKQLKESSQTLRGDGATFFNFDKSQISVLEDIDELESLEHLPPLEGCKCLYLSIPKVTSLKGIERCKGLERIIVDHALSLNEINSLGKLNNLTAIDLKDVIKLKNFEVLGEIINLEKCYISDSCNYLTDAGKQTKKLVTLPDKWPENLLDLDLIINTKKLGKLNSKLIGFSIDSNDIESLEGIENSHKINSEEEEETLSAKFDWVHASKACNYLDLSNCFSLRDLNGIENCTHLKKFKISPLLKNLEAISALKDLTITIDFSDSIIVDIPKEITVKQFASLSNLQPFSLVIKSNYDIDLFNLKNSKNVKSLDLSYAQITDFRFLSEMQNLEYVKLPSGSELSKELKSKEFTTEGQIAKLQMKILSL